MADPADLLVIAPHPDDAEIHAGGLIAAHVRQGRRVVVVDATAGELASRGTPAERAAEAAAAAQAIGLAARENLQLPDGGLSQADPAQRQAVVAAIRRWRASAVVTLSGHARHPDHIACAALVRDAAKAAALHRYAAATGPALAGIRLWFAEAELPIAAPALLVPLTEDDWARKLAAIRCYGSQLFQAGSAGPATSISRPEFLAWIEARGRTWGHQAGAAYAEALGGPEAPRLTDLCGI
jgi:bacillithiol biosynthesis deacetylase BshB1